MQRQPVSVGRNLVAGPVVTEIVLGFPGGIHDQVIGPSDDLQPEQARGEERLEDLIPLS